MIVEKEMFLGVDGKQVRMETPDTWYIAGTSVATLSK